MNNLQRLEMETKGINLDQEELIIYLTENNLQPFVEYNPQSTSDKRNIYCAGLGVLESIANNPQTMKTVKYEDTTVSDFHEQLLARIEQLEMKIRKMKQDEDRDVNGNVFMLFG